MATTTRPIHGFPVLERKPSKVSAGLDVVLVDRGDVYDRYVTGKVSSTDPWPSEWFWGNYHSNLADAVADFQER